MEAGVHPLPDVGNGGDGADLGGNLHGTYVALHAAFADIGSAVGAEMHLEPAERSLESGRDLVGVGNQPGLLRKQGHRPVEGAGVEVEEAEPPGYQSGEGALAGG